MLIEFSVENWMSFKEKATFSMVANNRLTKKQHLASFPEYHLNILPKAVMYGANGSGKTAFVKAIAFIKLFILEGNDRNDSIFVNPFRLSKSTQDAPSEFSITFFTREVCYEFSFSATKDAIITEELNKITKSGVSQNIYTRHKRDIQTQKSSPLKGMKEYVKDKQLFLTTALRNNQFSDIQTWFQFILTPLSAVSGYSAFREFTREGSFIRDGVNRILSTLGTGVTELSSIPLSEKQIWSTFRRLPAEGETIPQYDSTNERVFCYFQGGQLHGEQLVTKHLDDDGDEVIFSIARDESDGTQRLIDLLPAFIEHEKGNMPRVFIIDELERSLHTNITITLLKFFLQHCSHENRNQLIFTTHDTMLMDLDIFRRDEIWMAEKMNNQSKLFSLNDYKVRADKDVQKDYLRGLYGGTPTILLERLLKG